MTTRWCTFDWERWCSPVGRTPGRFYSCQRQPSLKRTRNLLSTSENPSCWWCLLPYLFMSQFASIQVYSLLFHPWCQFLRQQAFTLNISYQNQYVDIRPPIFTRRKRGKRLGAHCSKESNQSPSLVRQLHGGSGCGGPENPGPHHRPQTPQLFLEAWFCAQAVSGHSSIEWPSAISAWQRCVNVSQYIELVK